MTTLSDLAVLILAELQTPEAQEQTRYQIMTKINQKIHPLLSPYSPGAMYHELNKLAAANLIKFDQNKVSISRNGIEALHTHLFNAELPTPLCRLLVLVLAVLQLNDSNIRSKMKKRLLLYMIKNNQNQKGAPGENSPVNLELENWRFEISKLGKESILKMVAYL